jgi:hypothetical protein
MSLANELLARKQLKKGETELQITLNPSMPKIKTDDPIKRNKILANHGLTIGVLIEMTKEKQKFLTSLYLRNPGAFEMLVVGALYFFDRDAKKTDLEIRGRIIKLLIKSKSTNNKINAGMIDEADKLMSELQKSLSAVGEIKVKKG